MRHALAMTPSVDVSGRTGSFSDSVRTQIYSALLDKVAQALAVLDVEGRFLEMNEAQMRLMAPMESANDTPARYLGQETFEEMMRALTGGGDLGAESNGRDLMGRFMLWSIRLLLSGVRVVRYAS